MRKGRILLIFPAVILLFAILGLALSKPREPSYQGHSLSYWLSMAEPVDTIVAVHAIGTNAIPVLLTWISYETPAWRRALAGLALKYNLEQLFNRLNPAAPQKALKAFSLLRTNALPAMPALVKLTQETNHPEAATRATYALCFLGPKALPHLADVLASTNTTAPRAVIVSSIWGLCRDGASTNECLPLLIKATSDADPKVSAMARRAVLDLTPHRSSNAMLK